jgi:hypothetical protein
MVLVADTAICDWQVKELLEDTRKILRRSREIIQQSEKLVKQSRELMHDFAFPRPHRPNRTQEKQAFRQLK